MKKKLCSFVSTLLIIALLLPIWAVATDYQEPLLPEDIPRNTALFYHARRGVQLGLINGVCEDSFRFEPRRRVTRAEFITMLGRLHEYSNETIGTTNEGLFYERYLIWAAEIGIIHGNEHGDLVPHSYITYEQVVVIIYRYITEALGLSWETLQRPENHPLPSYTPFYIHPDISDWALKPAKTIDNAALLLPFHTNLSIFSPQHSVLRAEALMTLVRLQNRMALVSDEGPDQTTETYFVERFNLFNYYIHNARWAGFLFQLVDDIYVSLEGYNIRNLEFSPFLQASRLVDIINFVEPDLIMWIYPEYIIYLGEGGNIVFSRESDLF